MNRSSRFTRGQRHSWATAACTFAVLILGAGCSDDGGDGEQVSAVTTEAPPEDIQDEAIGPAPARPKLGQPLEVVPYDFSPFLRSSMELTPHEVMFFGGAEAGNLSLFSDTVSVWVWTLGSWNTALEATAVTVEGQVSVHPTDIVGSIPATDIDAWIAANSVAVSADRSSTVAGLPARVIDLTVLNDADTVEPDEFLWCDGGECIFYADPPVELLTSWGSAPVRSRPMLDTGLLYRFWFLEGPSDPVLIVAEAEEASALDAVEAELIPTVRIQGA